MKDGMSMVQVLKNVNKATNEQALLADRLTSRYNVIAWRNGIQIAKAFNITRNDAWTMVERNEQKMGNVTIYVYKNGSKKHCFKSSVSNTNRVFPTG